MKIFSKNNKGFTLIELLVVIAIIGLLSSVVLASLNTSRKKAKDVAIKEGVAQFVNLLALEYFDNKSYCKLQPSGWINGITGTNTCDYAIDSITPPSSYASQAKKICNNIYNNAGDNWGSTGVYRIYPYVQVVYGGCVNNYTLTVALNNGKWYCSGSSGRKGEYDTSSFNGTQPGCYGNP
ncbi:MAG: type II secretion system protein [Patescibacteria group bacterium]